MPPRANLRKRTAASKPSPAKKLTRSSTRQPRRISEQTGTRLKLVLSSSSSSSKPSLAESEEDEDELLLSGEELQEDEEEEETEEDEDEVLKEDEEEEDDELDLESSPVKLSPRRSSGKLQLKIPKIKLSQLSSNSSSSPIPTDAEDEQDEEDIEEDEVDEEEEDSFEDEEIGGPDLSKMTARQKAKLEQESRMYMDVDEVLPPSKKKPGLTEEEILKRAEKSRRRKLQQDQRMEEHKQATIQRLLMKQGAKSKKMKLEQVGEGNVSVESLGTVLEPEKPFEGFRYVDSKDSTCLLITDEKTFEQVFAQKVAPKAESTCSAPGCHNPKKYTHAKVNRPVCSLQCYKLIDTNSLVK